MIATSFFALHGVIHPRATTEFIYRYNDHDVAQVFVSIKLETTNREKEVAEVLAELEKLGMTGFDISNNELAKSHARYMVGGRSGVPNERIFRFGAFSGSFSLEHTQKLTAPAEFPERPGALRRFLEGIQSGWNISLFHYRNHGAGTVSCPTA